MQAKEFDKFVDEYYNIHALNISISGEKPDYFAEYKIRDVALQYHANDAQPRTILDCGSGVGNSVPYFRKYFPKSSLTCADVSSRCLEVSRERYPGQEHYTQIEGHDLPFSDNGFDLAFSACVFHHIIHLEHEHWLRELHRVTAAGGKLFVFEHNPLNPLTVSAVRNCPFDENARLINGWTMSKRIAKAGWSNVKVRYRIFFPRKLAMLRMLEPHLCLLPFGAQYYVCGEKRGKEH